MSQHIGSVDWKTLRNIENLRTKAVVLLKKRKKENQQSILANTEMNNIKYMQTKLEFIIVTNSQISVRQALWLIEFGATATLNVCIFPGVCYILTSIFFCHGGGLFFLTGMWDSRLCLLVGSCSSWLTLSQLSNKKQNRTVGNINRIIPVQHK